MITEEDKQFKFITGNNAFEELTPNGSLTNYIKQDTIDGGKCLTYLLIERQESGNELLGLLRFRYTTIKEFLEQLSVASVSKDIKKNIEKLFSLKNIKLYNLSRIGISEKHHEMIRRKRYIILFYSLFFLGLFIEIVPTGISEIYQLCLIIAWHCRKSGV